MANNNKSEVPGILVYGRLSFDDLYTPTPSVEGGRLKYRCNIIIDPNTDVGKADIKKIGNLIRLVELDKFKKSPPVPGYKSLDRQCFVDGDSCVNQKTSEVYDGYEGMKILKASNDKRPSVVNRDMTPLVEDDNVTYAGCYCNFFVRIYAVAGADKGGNGIFASLEAVQFAKKGEPFGGAPVDPNSVFKKLDSGDEGEGGEEDPLG